MISPSRLTVLSEIFMPFALFFLLRRARHLQIVMLER
jgi:hypothetical protein